MNRDEQVSRGSASPPAKFTVRGVEVIYPRDTAGGTWVAANSYGVALALLNWYGAGVHGQKTRTRGGVIPALAGLASSRDVCAAGKSLDLSGVLPFRLVGVFPSEKRLCEWRWNQAALDCQSFPWERRHWFSSGLSDEKAALHRGSACNAAWEDPDASSLEWLRKLHGSHDQERSPFSVCVHREGVETLSYTEITFSGDKVRCGYFSGSPCQMIAPEPWVEMRCRV
jgi:hypothetical protein